MKAPKGATAVVAGLALLIGFLFYTLISHSAHVLYQLPQWVSAKSLIPNGLISAQEFFLERQTLAHDRLNLASWNGPNEVHWNVPSGWNRLELEVSLSQNSYLWIFFRQTANRRLGFRLSRHEKYKSGFFELNSGKEFVQKELFEYSASTDEPQKVTVLSDINGTSLQVDDNVLFSKEIDPAIPQLLSFRSSLNQVVLDNLKLSGANYAVAENFSPRVNLLHVVLAVAFALVVLLAFFKLALFKATAALVLVALIMLMAVGADRYAWAPGYYYKGFAGYGVATITDIRLEFDTIRRKLFFLLFKTIGDSRSAFVLSEKNYMSRFFIPENAEQLSETAKKIYYPNGLEENTSATRRQYIDEQGQVEFLEQLSDLHAKPEKPQRIAFLGTSQTFGGGAQSLNMSFPAQVVAALNSCSKKGVTGFNFSAPGENSAQLLQSYKELLKFWQPKLLIVNLSHNDKDPQQFRNNLAELLKLNSSLKIRTVLAKEPNSPELTVQHLGEKYQILQELAQQFGVDLLDLPKYLNSENVYDGGLLWWDIVHFDQAGHNATAKWLTARLCP